ncbi:ABC transporter permease [Nocardia cyriacigeorgica]|uniref:Oligopeptide transport system permease protein OppC n=1 Tax=Nocardia cyriacigeorgica TaxID=135487 RepID=A0A4U8WFF2_9NOCA|nr:ABC transporter permease [Nocardia cyriacigeorgica]MBF6101021.1 ABC transporter permease [Nocardia cyriacigeorgica]MBF6162827.1 ABC transporter permease [Nocardia cyriacigeorgica]MBF6201873.1 ABC transporter permease [Nocardia cyriacigeorgica]MBF6315439.1 ABC transporter permease [Nocardia cyriacigeorgica]MBF6413165.1 ABC transporter permease [Nocardia cyriacigeorgica]
MTEAEIIVQGAPEVAASGRRKLVWRRFLRNKPAVAGAIILVLLFIVSFALPPFLPYDYQQLDYTALLKPPSPEHPFGTTQIGQDVLAQTLRGLQKSLIIGFCVAIISTTIAALAGTVAGLLGGWTDRAIMWFVDLLLVVPSFIIIALFAPRTKGSGSILLLILLLALFGWMISARIVRGLTLSLREREFVRAARYMGAPTRTVILSHIVPNIASILIIDTTLTVGASIMAETGLSFLGFGVQPPDVSLGSLIASGTKSALTYPWLFLFAGGLLIITVLCANLVGDGLRDAFDPSAKRARSRKAKVKP